MPVEEILEVATVAGEVSSATVEIVESVDLTTVSLQLADIQDILLSVSFGQMVLCGVLLGAAVILVLAVMFRD